MRANVDLLSTLRSIVSAAAFLRSLSSRFSQMLSQAAVAATIFVLAGGKSYNSLLLRYPADWTLTKKEHCSSGALSIIDAIGQITITEPIQQFPVALPSILTPMV